MTQCYLYTFKWAVNSGRLRRPWARTRLPSAAHKEKETNTHTEIWLSTLARSLASGKPGAPPQTPTRPPVPRPALPPPVLDLWCSGRFSMETLPRRFPGSPRQLTLRPCLPKFCGCYGGSYGGCHSASHWLTSAHVWATRTAPCTARLQTE